MLPGIVFGPANLFRCWPFQETPSSRPVKPAKTVAEIKAASPRGNKSTYPAPSGSLSAAQSQVRPGIAPQPPQSRASNLRHRTVLQPPARGPGFSRPVLLQKVLAC